MYKIIRENNKVKEIKYSLLSKISLIFLLIFFGAVTIFAIYGAYVSYIKQDIFLSIILVLLGFLGGAFITSFFSIELIKILKFRLNFQTEKLMLYSLKGNIEILYEDIKIYGHIKNVLVSSTTTNAYNDTTNNIAYFLTEKEDLSEINYKLYGRFLLTCGLIEDKGFYISEEEGSEKMLNLIYSTINSCHHYHIKRVDVKSVDLLKSYKESKKNGKTGDGKTGDG